MSTVQSYRYQVDQAELRRRQLVAIESRKLKAAQLQTQQHMNQLNNQLQTITAEMDKLAVMDLRLVKNHETLNEMRKELHAAQSQLVAAKQHLTQQIKAAKTLHSETDCEKQALQDAIRQSQYALSDVDRLSRAS